VEGSKGAVATAETALAMLEAHLAVLEAHLAVLEAHLAVIEAHLAESKTPVVQQCLLSLTSYHCSQSYSVLSAWNSVNARQHLELWRSATLACRWKMSASVMI